MFNKINELAIIPSYQTSGSVGMDLHSTEKTFINPGEWKLVKTGLTIDLPVGVEAQIRPRSGLAFKHGITVLNSPGTIDSDYKGELCIVLINHGDKYFNIDIGDRIAQLVLAEVYIASDYINEAVRGEGGFGSTGL